MCFLWLKGNILEGSIHKILKNWFMLGSLTVWMDAEVWRAREKRKTELQGLANSDQLDQFFYNMD